MSPTSSRGAPPATDHAVLLFDGVCNLCNGFVNFVIDRDPSGYFRFGSLQSDAARTYLNAFGEDAIEVARGELSSVVLVENGQLYTRSTAALRVLHRLGAPWALFYAFMAVPRPLRDRVYDYVAAHRYEWFGRRQECRVPTPELRGRFIDTDKNGAMEPEAVPVER